MDDFIEIGHVVQEEMRATGEIRGINLKLKVLGRTSKVRLTYGQLYWRGKVFEDSYLVTMDLVTVIVEHAKALPLTLHSGEYAEGLSADYAVPARDAVRLVCEKYGWRILREISHAPILHFIVKMN
jgi:hypothetical protein